MSPTTPPLVSLVFGAEEYLAARYIRTLRLNLAQKNSALEVHELEASDYVSGQLFSLASPSLFAEPRLIICRSVERCTDEFIEDALSYLQEIEPEVYLIFRHNGSSVRGKKLLEELRKSALEFAALPITKDGERQQFVKNEFENLGRQITHGAVRALLDAFADDLGELATACEQLAQDSKETVTEDLVDSYYGGRVETNAFKVIDAALSGRVGESLALLRHALTSGVDPVPLVAAISSKIRQLAKLHGNRSASAATLGMAPWQLERARKDLVGWDEHDLATVISELVHADAAAKGFSRDPEFVLEKLVRLIATKGK